MKKFRYQDYVQEHSSFYVLGVGPNVGLRTRLKSIEATARTLGKNIKLRFGRIGISTISPTKLDFEGCEAVVLVIPEGFDAIKFAGEISETGVSVYTTSIKENGSFSPEYEAALQEAQNRMVESFLSDEAKAAGDKVDVPIAPRLD